MKRGLADIVTSVLLILVVLSAASAAWVSIQKFVFKGSGNLEGSTDCLSIRLNPIYCNYNPDNGEMTVSVKREPGRGNLEDMLLSFINPSGETQTVYAGEAIDELESATFNLENIDFPLSGILDFAVSAIIGTGTNQRTCESSRTIQCTVSTEGIGPSDGCDFDYGNDFPNPEVCDVVLMEQSGYSSLDLDSLSMTNNAVSVGQRYFCNDPNTRTFEEILDCPYETIQLEFRNYLDNILVNYDENTMILIDIEAYLSPGNVASYTDPEIRDRVINAIKLRVDATRKVLPNNPLVLWNTIRPRNNGEDNAGHRGSMEMYRLMGERGVYDNLTYFLPNAYIRFGLDDSNFDTYEAMTRQAIEGSSELTLSDGITKLPIALLLSFQVFNDNSNNNRDLVELDVSRHQTLIAQEYPQIDRIVYWTGSDTGTTSVDGNVYDIYGFLQEVKPVPRVCVCPSG